MYVLQEMISTYPIKVWLKNGDVLEESCLRQVMNLAELPFIHKWIALMPDVHTGKGMPIGGVIGVQDVVIPNAVGVDIGCGVAYLEMGIETELLKNIKTANGSLLQGIIGDILRNIPLGVKHHRDRQSSAVIDAAMIDPSRYVFAEKLLPEIANSYYQSGTLGGGNHFIELQEDDNGLVGIMIHSGSRHLGHQICSYFNDIAKANSAKWSSAVPDEYGLAYLPVDSVEGQSYINWMNLALDFAQENRDRMMQDVVAIITKQLKRVGIAPPSCEGYINCHHNYSKLEHHYGKDVWVHRKGAIRARQGELGIIPGAMGSYSYIVTGKGNPESFNSCSHGAGRIMSRTKAKATFNMENVLIDLKARGVVLGKNKKSDVSEESRHAYKDIDDVINNELDLITPLKRLQTIGVVKG